VGPVWDGAGKRLDLGRTRVMGILNVTPDSFSDGGEFLSLDRALRRALAMVEEGAAIIDVGGESTRPGAQPVPEAEELDRVIPVIEALAGTLSVPISVDTSKPGVMEAAARAGAGMINDVYALRRPGAIEAARATALPVCLMHMQGEPRTMQQDPRYGDVVGEVKRFLAQRMKACTAAGIPRERIIVDPGFGFGKTLAHNVGLLRRLGEFQDLGVPVLVGISRKSMLARVAGAPAMGRLYPSVAAAVIAAINGARIVRAHDVGPAVEALAMVDAVYGD
jgi:dihydropteroate synthase